MEYAALHGIIWAKGTFWVTVAVLIFLFLFGRKILGFVNKMLDDRSTEIEHQLDEAATLRAEAEAMLKDAETRKSEALVQAKEMLALASREANRLAAELVEEAHATAKRREQMAQERIVSVRDAAVSEIRQQAARLASRATAIVLREMVDAEQDNRLIESSIEAMPKALLRRTA